MENNVMQTAGVTEPADINAPESTESEAVNYRKEKSSICRSIRYLFRNMKRNSRARLMDMLEEGAAENEALRARLKEAEDKAVALEAASSLDPTVYLTAAPDTGSSGAASYCAALRQAYGEELMMCDCLRDQQAAYTDAIKQDANAAIDRMQGMLLRGTENAVEQIGAMKREMLSALTKFQSDIFQTELKPLAYCFTQLVRIIQNTDDTAARLAENSQLSTPAEEEFIRLRKNLQSFLTVFDKAMLRLGLKAYYPEAGTPFNEIEQIPDTDDMPLNAIVVRCAEPGITHTAGGISSILIKAAVELAEADNTEK